MKRLNQNEKRTLLLELDRRIASKKAIIQAAQANFFKKPQLDIKFAELDNLIEYRAEIARS